MMNRLIKRSRRAAKQENVAPETIDQENEEDAGEELMSIGIWQILIVVVPGISFILARGVCHV